MESWIEFDLYGVAIRTIWKMATAAEPTEVDEMVYGYQINKGLEAWAEKKYEFSKHEVQVKKKYNITETRDWWPKRKVLAVYESWVEKKTKNVSIAWWSVSKQASRFNS